MVFAISGINPTEVTLFFHTAHLWVRFRILPFNFTRIGNNNCTAKLLIYIIAAIRHIARYNIRY